MPRNVRTLAEVLREILSVPDFAGIEAIDPNTCGNFNTYPLHVAAVWNDCVAIRLLVESGACLDQEGEHGFTPLMEAVAQGNSQAAELLISLGAKPLPNDYGELPSAHALVLGHAELASLLLRLNR
jgi:ankyrin repeat protein